MWQTCSLMPFLRISVAVCLHKVLNLMCWCHLYSSLEICSSLVQHTEIEWSMQILTTGKIISADSEIKYLYTWSLPHNMSPVYWIKGKVSNYNLAWRQKGGVQVLFYSSFNFGPTVGCVVKAMAQPLYPQKWPGTHCIRGWVGPRASLVRCEKCHPHQDLIPSPWRVTKLTTLSWPTGYWLTYCSMTSSQTHTLPVTCYIMLYHEHQIAVTVMIEAS
jgi:hypothetical protein